MKLTKIESYEIQAFAFHVMTGYMAPGKDVSPLACEVPYEERCAAWDEWRNKHAHCILAMLHGFEALIDRDDEPTGALLDEMEQMRELADALAHGTHFVDSPELHEAMTKAANVLRQCAEQRPDGWQLVPVEPTGLMVDAGREAMQRAPDLGGIVSANTAEVMDSYTAMLAAAPAVPQAEPKREPLSDEQIDAALQTDPAATVLELMGGEMTVGEFKLALRRLARTVEHAHGISGGGHD